jgi:hypothetical protein
MLLPADGDDAVVVVDAFLDLPAGGGATPTFTMSVGGSSADHRVELISEPSAEVSVLLFIVTFHANLAHSLTRSP